MQDTPQRAAVDAGPSEGPLPPGDLRVERYDMVLTDALTGEKLGYGGGDTPEEAARRAIEDANVSGEMMEPLETNNDGVRD
jgi:hypothetical protein